jgi:hypothetical protein
MRCSFLPSQTHEHEQQIGVFPEDHLGVDEDANSPMLLSGGAGSISGAPTRNNSMKMMSNVPLVSLRTQDTRFLRNISRTYPGSTRRRPRITNRGTIRSEAGLASTSIKSLRGDIRTMKGDVYIYTFKMLYEFSEAQIRRMFVPSVKMSRRQYYASGKSTG